MILLLMKTLTFNSLVMMLQNLHVRELITLLLFIAGGMIVGWIAERIIVGSLGKIAARTKWKGDDAIVSSLKGIILPLIVLISIHISLNYMTLKPGMLDVIHKLIKVASILVGTVFITRLATKIVIGETKDNSKGAPSTIIVNLTRIITIVLGILIALQSIGISITPILTALGVGGLAVALALQSTLSNFFSGLHILANKKIRSGDYIQLDSGVEGYVIDISWRSTTIRQTSNNLVIVPNTKLAEAVIINMCLPQKELSVLVELGVSYDSDLELVEKVTIDTARQTLQEVKGGVKNFEPFIRYHTFADSSINFTVILKANEYVSQYELKHEFIKRIHRKYNEVGIDIPFPIRTVYLKK